MKPFPTLQDRLPLLSIQDKAERHLLPDELSIEEIGTLLYEDKVDRHGFYYGITEACQTGEIKYSGDIDSERVNYDNWAKDYREVEFPNHNYRLLDYPDKEKIDSACLQAYWEIVDRNNFDIYKVMSPANCLIHRDDLAEYLKTKELWPVEGCLLANWWFELQVEAVVETKPRKELLPKQRDTTEGLLLIYEICEKQNVHYLDELPGPIAWAKIVSKEFKSDLIKGVSDAKKSIVLASGAKLERANFLDTYRKRFRKNLKP